MGGHAHCPDERGRRQVEALAAYDVPELDIARVVGIDPQDAPQAIPGTNSTAVASRIAESHYRKAMGDGGQSVTACIFWLKTPAHWKETTVHEQTVTHGPILKIVSTSSCRSETIVPALVTLIEQVREV